jgi:histidinol-phosphatase (PHP family)
LGDYLDITEEIFKLLIHKGKGIEINTSGLRYSLDSTSPPLEFIQRFKDLGGEIITIGSDAHAPEQIGLGLDIALEMAKSAGFKYVATFSKGIPQFNKIA